VPYASRASLAKQSAREGFASSVSYPGHRLLLTSKQEVLANSRSELFRARLSGKARRTSRDFYRKNPRRVLTNSHDELRRAKPDVPHATSTVRTLERFLPTPAMRYVGQSPTYLMRLNS